SGGFEQLAILASAAILLIYLMVILATLRMRRKKPELAEKTFKVPGGWIIPVIGITSILWLLSSLSAGEFLSIAVFLVIICTIYIGVRWIKRKER
ncbi:MAG: amino acid permease, partial [Muriicola sp.]|nr:amino acid permease [Muriicola sp.]NNK36114.1 amino acid permease [Eudoraea sp.]